MFKVNTHKIWSIRLGLLIELLVILSGCSHLRNHHFDFNTLQQKISKAEPGAIFEIPEGEFSIHNLRLSGKGTVEKPIIIRGQQEKTVLIGLGSNNGSKSEPEEKNLIPAILIIENSEHIILENLKVRDSSGEGIRIWNSHHIEVRNTTIEKTWGKGLGGSGTYLRFINNRIFDTVLQNENEMVLKDRNLGIVRSWSAAAATWHQPNGEPSSNVIWKNNLIQRSWGEGLTALQVTDAQLIGNIVQDTYATAIYIDHAKRVTVKDNSVSHQNHDRISSLENDVAPGIMMAAENYPSMKPFVLEDIQIIENNISNVSVGIGFWRDLANKSEFNFYRSILIENNSIKSVSLLPISIQKIETEKSANNVISGNLIQLPQKVWKKSGKKTAIRNEDPQLWRIFNNQIIEK